MTFNALPKINLDLRSTAPGRPVRLEWLPLAKLCIDDRYQRDVTQSGVNHVKRIAAAFRWQKFAPVIVTVTGEGKDSYAIIDGQHRCMAALALGYDLVPCAVVDTAVEEAASIFSAVNGTVLKISAQSMFKAALAAGVQWALALNRACESAGVTPLNHPVPTLKQKPGMTNAVGIMRRIVERDGEDALAAVLRLVMAEPLSDVPGFICRKVIERQRERLANTQGWQKNPHAVVDQMLGEALTVSRQPIADSFNEKEVWENIQDLKARHYTKSMVAASLKLRYAAVEKLWEAVT